MRNLNKFLAIAFASTFVLSIGFLSYGQEETAKVGERKIVTLDVKSMDIVEVLKIISDTSGWTIICSPRVKGRVTLWIKDITVQELLDEVLAVNGYVYTRKGNSLTVMTQDEYARMYGKERKVFLIRYADVNDMAAYLKNISSREGKVIADPRTRKIVVIDTEENLKRMEELIARLDDETIAYAFELKFADPDQVKAVLEKMISVKGKIESDKRTGQVIITDVPQNIENIQRIVTQLDKESRTYVYQLNYADAEKIKGKLAKLLPESEGIIQIDKKTDTVIVIAVPEKLAQIEKLLPIWDRKTKQVLIQAEVMLVSVNKLKKIGIDWTWLDSHSFEAAIGLPPKMATDAVASGLTVGIGSLDRDEYHAVIQALETDTDTELLASPKILVLDGEEAKFSVGSDQPYKVITLDAGARIEDVKFARVGVTLSVTPEINEAGFITMKVHPEVSSLSDVREGIPVVEKREAQSTVMVEDGKTIIIGGLIQTEDIKIVNRVPILGRIPLLGFFFRNIQTDKTEKELLIFLTPLITHEEKIAEVASPLKRIKEILKERSRERCIRKAEAYLREEDKGQ